MTVLEQERTLGAPHTLDKERLAVVLAEADHLVGLVDEGLAAMHEGLARIDAIIGRTQQGLGR
ncbi:hypothetical protein [Nonomuraea sp. NPDC005650]|uniref:hypothetical protein n=1 Tax=Nonomuraea sp. NPDC005650 TaxID=3157045 RepID=UPI0033B8A0C1